VKSLKFKVQSLALLLFFALVLTGCLPKKEGEPVGEGASTKQEKSVKEESYSGNLEKMMGLGIPLKCTWKMNENYYGTSWVKGKNSYGEIVQEGRTAKVINKDNCMWAWEEGNPQGTKMCMEISQEEMKEQVEESKAMMKQQGFQTPDVDYKCLPAIVSDSKFNPPGNVNFMDVGEMMQGFGN